MIGLSRRRVMGSGVPIPLPYDAEIKYLQGASGAYIDTGISDVYLDNTDWELYIETNVAGGINMYDAKFKGSGYNGSNALFVGFNYQNARHVKIYTANTRYSTSGRVAVHIKCKDGKASCTVNNSSILSNSSRSSFTLPAFFLFAAANDNKELNSNSVLTSITVSKCWLSVGGIMKINLIPVRVGQVGYMYDKVSRQLLGSAGTGSFVLGNDVTT